MRKYLPEPDYSRPRLELPAGTVSRLRDKLESLYGADGLDTIFEELLRLLQVFHAHKSDAMLNAEASGTAQVSSRFNEQDAICREWLLAAEDESPGDWVDCPACHQKFVIPKWN